MLSCKEATRLVSESFDRTLPLNQRIALRVHLLLCKFCNRYRKHLLLIREAIRRHPDRVESHEEPPSPSLSPEARERIKRSLTPED